MVWICEIQTTMKKYYIYFKVYFTQKHMIIERYSKKRYFSIIMFSGKIIYNYI